MANLEFYTYATDPDHALELAGHGAGEEFESARQALKGYDPDVHEDRKLYKVTVEEVKEVEDTTSD